MARKVNMPYKIKGNAVIKANTGEVVGHSENPKQYLKVLNMVEHGVKMNKNKQQITNGNRISKKSSNRS